MMQRMSHSLADRLLDAQVEWVMAELEGERLRENVERDLQDILGVLDEPVVAEAVSRETVKAIAHTWVTMIGDSPVIEEMAEGIADAVYALADADEHKLGEVIAREHVDDLVRRVLAMRTLRDQLLALLMESPVVATVASGLVTRIVADRLPGGVGGGVVGVGRRAAALLGDAAGRSAQFALRRLSAAIVETMDQAPLHEAVMEVWTIQADEPMSNLREYLSQDELRELVSIIHEIWLTLRDTEYFTAAVDAGIDVFFDRYGAMTVGALLSELGVDREQLAADAQLLVPPIVDAVRETGMLEPIVRDRLAPFWESEAVAALLARH